MSLEKSSVRSSNVSTNQPINQPSNQLIPYILHLADNSLILGHRNSEWTGHGPILEQDIAISNIALDLVGQSRNLYQYAAKLINESNSASAFLAKVQGDVTEDDLAYLRDVSDFKNCLLTEQPNGDWAHTILRQFFFSAYQYYLYTALRQSTDQQLAAIAEKSVKETTYHLRWSSEWVIRLGDGTTESHERMVDAVKSLWIYTAELFIPADYEEQLTQSGTAADITLLEPYWHDKVKSIFEEATLIVPAKKVLQKGGKEGLHSRHLEDILAEMQFLQRTYPGATW